MEQELRDEIAHLNKLMSTEQENHKIKVTPLDSQILQLRTWLDEVCSDHAALVPSTSTLDDGAL